MKKPEFIGPDQIINKAIVTPDDNHQTVRDTTNAYGEQYMKKMKKVIEEHSTLTEPYCIEVKSRRDLPTSQALHITFIARRTLPLPQWDHTVYEVDNRSNSVFLCWSLPAEAEAIQITKRPDLFSDKLVQCCHDFLKINDCDEDKVELEINALIRKWHQNKDPIL